jgi:hypothetical protein
MHREAFWDFGPTQRFAQGHLVYWNVLLAFPPSKPLRTKNNEITVLPYTFSFVTVMGFAELPAHWIFAPEFASGVSKSLSFPQCFGMEVLFQNMADNLIRQL